MLASLIGCDYFVEPLAVLAVVCSGVSIFLEPFALVGAIPTRVASKFARIGAERQIMDSGEAPDIALWRNGDRITAT